MSSGESTGERTRGDRLEADPPGPTADPLTVLRDLAVRAIDLAFCITDPTRADNPLVWVNPAFTRVTGYQLDEVEGRNCRLLQGPATEAEPVARLRSAIAERRPVTATLLNYRKDGTAYWNQVSVSPVFDDAGTLVSYVAVQADVTERVRIETERSRAHAAERAARHDSERSRRRLGLLAEASTQLSATLETRENLERLADLVVPELADWVVINQIDARQHIERSVLRHQSGLRQLLSRYAELQRDSLTEMSGTRRVVADGEPILIADASESEWHSHTRSDELRQVVERLGLVSAMYVPLVARAKRTLGTMMLVVGPSGRRFGEEDLAVAADLGRRAGMTFDNARLYEREHRVAETLQHSLLPELPDVDGLRVAARYLPGDALADVGGDFYEILPLPDGSIGVAVGDVAGHDMSAAAAMGHLRGLLRACAWDNAENSRCDPAEVLDRVDRLVQGLHVAPLATLLYGRLERPTVPGGSWLFTYANAGHPSPQLRLPDGQVDVLDEASGVTLGVSDHGRHRSATVEFPPGADLVVFTDGLVERRGEDIDEGIRRVGDVLRTAGHRDVEGLADLLVSPTTVGAERFDDTAVIVVRAVAEPSGGD